jgi:hypothetical protein
MMGTRTCICYEHGVGGMIGMGLMHLWRLKRGSKDLSRRSASFARLVEISIDALRCAHGLRLDKLRTAKIRQAGRVDTVAVMLAAYGKFEQHVIGE